MFSDTTFRAKVLQADGETRVTVMGTCGYGSRTVSTTVEITDEKLIAQIGQLLDRAIKTAASELREKTAVEAARALVAASTMNEKI